MTAADFAPSLLIGAVVVLVGVLAVRVASRVGLPSLLIYLGLGVVLGEAGLGIEFENAELTQILGLTALAIILAEGGLTTRWSSARPLLAQSVVLSTVGIGVSVTITAGIAMLVFDVSLQTALLLGAVVSSTDAAAVFASLRRLGLPTRVTATLELESGFNDAPAVLLVVALSEALTTDQDSSLPSLIGLICYELLAGAAIGIGIGVAGAWLLRRSALPVSGLYPLATIALCLTGYATATVAHSSGFLAVYVCGLVLGNSALPHRSATLGFAEGLAWLAQIGLFVLLGLLASPGRLLGVIGPAILLGLALLLLARPASVFLSMSWFKIPWQDRRSCRGRASAELYRSCWPPFRSRWQSRMPNGSSTRCSSWWSFSPSSRAPHCQSSHAGCGCLRHYLNVRWRSSPPPWRHSGPNCCS